MQAPSASQSDDMHDTRQFHGTVLLLEDEALIALDLEEFLHEAGYRDVIALSACTEAEFWLKANSPALAILDPMLRDGVCEDVALVLGPRNVPFVVYSGREPDETGLSPFSAGKWLRKPSSPENMLAALEEIARERICRSGP